MGRGDPDPVEFHLGDGSFTIENYHLSVASHEEALRRAGFRDIRWHPAAGGMRADPRASRAPFCELGRGLRRREKNATEAGAGRLEKPAPDARAAPMAKIAEDFPLTGQPSPGNRFRKCR